MLVSTPTFNFPQYLLIIYIEGYIIFYWIICCVSLPLKLKLQKDRNICPPLYPQSLEQANTGHLINPTKINIAVLIFKDYFLKLGVHKIRFVTNIGSKHNFTIDPFMIVFFLLLVM